MTTARYLLVGTAVCLCAPALAQENSPAARCTALTAALQQQLDSLVSVRDTATARAALQPLQATLGTLAAMDTAAEAEKALWTYIDNSAEAKARLVEILQRTAAEFTRLEKADFFGCAELADLLRPQLQNAAAPTPLPE